MFTWQLNKVGWLFLNLIANSHLYAGYLAIYDGSCSTFFIYSPYQRTPLHIAAREGHVDIVRYLVDKDADPNIKDEDGVSECEYTADCLFSGRLRQAPDVLYVIRKYAKTLQ